jgi:regulator of sigma D
MMKPSNKSTVSFCFCRFVVMVLAAQAAGHFSIYLEIHHDDHGSFGSVFLTK